MEAKTYKIRCIVLFIFLLISILIAIPMKNILIEENNILNETIEFVESNDDETVKTETTLTKEEALDVLNKMKEYYSFIDEYSESTLYFSLILGMFGLLSGFMLYFILTDIILKKCLPDLKRWMSWLIRIIICILLLPYIYVLIAAIGVFLCIPNFIYQIYKYIKLKNKENKDDIITE